jgi:hypothetical protein
VRTESWLRLAGHILGKREAQLPSPPRKLREPRSVVRLSGVCSILLKKGKNADCHAMALGRWHSPFQRARGVPSAGPSRGSGEQGHRRMTRPHRLMR